MAESATTARYKALERIKDANKMIQKINDGLERIIKQTPTPQVDTQPETHWYTPLKKAALTATAIITLIPAALGLTAKDARAENQGCQETQGGLYCDNKLIGLMKGDRYYTIPGDKPLAQEIGGILYFDKSTGRGPLPIIHLNENRQPPEESIEQKAGAPPQAQEERITNVNEYLSRAGQELEAGHTEIARKMYDTIFQQRNDKKIKLSDQQLIDTYVGKAQSFVLESRLQEGLITYKAAEKKFPNKPTLKYFIEQTEKKMKK